jgi:RNA polymerase sigma-70 factor (ECF subfamily)
VERERSDGEIIAASADDAALFAVVFDRHFAEVQRYLARRVGVALADELAAETFVAAFRGRQTFDLVAVDARPWLFGIAANLMRRHWRTERRRLRAYARTGVDRVGDELADAEERVDAAAAGPRLAAALASLSRADREVLLLFAWADLSYEEIAVAVAIPVGTVRSRLSRARTRMREALTPAAREQPAARGDEPSAADRRIEVESAIGGERHG